MWKPPERIRHDPGAASWPTNIEAKRSLLFAPLDKKRLSLSSRTWIPAMVPWRATNEGFVTDDVIDWYSRFAKGRPGALVVEATGIRDVPSGPLLRIGHDRFLPGLKKLTKAVREASEGQTKIFIQLIDFLSVRRRPSKENFLSRFLVVTDTHRQNLGKKPAVGDDQIRQTLLELDDKALAEVLTEREYESYAKGYRERVTDTDRSHIRELPQILPELFLNASIRAEQVGFDGVELHYAHAYTMASFLSKLNTRDDGYGGDLSGRLRLPLEVFNAVRRGVSDDFVVGCRMLSEDCVAGGTTIDESACFACNFAKAGMDYISFSRGGKFEDALVPKRGEAIYPYTGPSGYECMPQAISDEKGPFGRNVQATHEIKQALSASNLDIPIVVAGGMHNFQQAEGVLLSGKADIIGFARQALADPDWFEKVRTGAGAAVNLCKYTNYCEGLDQKHKMVTCQLWDRKDLGENGTMLTPDGKRRTTAPPWQRSKKQNQIG